MTPEIFAKHAKRVVKNAEKTAKNVPAVRFINVENGALYTTDSHRSYRYENDSFETNGLLNIDLTPAANDLIYPAGALRGHNEVLRMDKEWYENNSFCFNRKELTAFIKELKALKKVIESKEVIFKVVARNGVMKVSNRFDEKQSFTVESNMSNGEIEFYMNAVYLIQTLEMFKTTGDEYIELKFFQKHKPVLFKGLGNPNLTAIVLPVRING